MWTSLKTGLALMMLAAAGVAVLPSLHAQDAPGFGEQPVADPAIEWEFHDATGILKQDARISNVEPGRNWVIRLPRDGGAIMHIRLEHLVRGDGSKDGPSEAAFKDTQHPRWPAAGGSGAIRRYNNGPAIAALRPYLGDSPQRAGGKIRFRRLDRGPMEARNILERPLADVEFLRFPQTWENVWLAQVVDGIPVDQRLERVRAFDRAFRLRIENRSFKDTYFTPEEQGAYASFYQAQFSSIRNANPQNPDIYSELADFHRNRDNVDAELSVYLDAIRNEVPEEDRQVFHLRAGELLGLRLNLWAEAVPHLDSAFGLAEARLLLVDANWRLGRHEDALDTADALVAQIEQDATSETPLLAYAEEGAEYRDLIRQRALLLKGRSLHIQNRFGEAILAIRPLLPAPSAAPLGNNPGGAAQSAEEIAAILAARPTATDEATLLRASMYAFRGRITDTSTNNLVDGAVLAVNDLMRNLKWRTTINEALKAQPDWSAVRYDPAGCRAVCLFVDLRTPSPGATVPADMLRALDFAAALDPMSGEPWLVRGKLYERSGWRGTPVAGGGVVYDLADAVDAYQRGLAVDPISPELHYQLGVLRQRGNDLSAADRHFSTCLLHEPEYWPAMNRLGEIRLAYAGGAEATVVSLMTEEPTPETDRQLSEAFAQVIQYLREAASLYSASLELQPRQYALRSALGALSIRLASYFDNNRLPGNDRELATSYLRSARRHAREVELAIDAREESPTAPVLPSDELAPISALTVLASASYQLGVRLNERALIEDAIRALERHRGLMHEIRHFPGQPQMRAYQESDAAAWAVNALRELKARERQRQKVEDFAGLNSSDIAQLGNGWLVLAPDNVDPGTEGQISIANGTLTIGTERQQLAGFVTRVSREERFTTLRSFQATIPRLGRSGAARGIHLTKAESDGDAGGVRLTWCILVGFDEENRLFYDCRYIDNDNATEASMFPGGRQYIPASNFGLRGMDAFPADESITFGIEREVPEESGGTIYYYIRMFGPEGPRVALDLSPIGNISDQDVFTNSAELQAEGLSLRIGFFVQAAAGATGRMNVASCRWVIDSNLANLPE